MSASGELLPSNLKWVVLGCFVGLIAIMIATYIASPKLIFEDLTANNTLEPLQVQASPPAALKQSTIASPSAELDTAHNQSSVESVIDEPGSSDSVSQTAPLQINANTDGLAMSSPANPSTTSVSHCDFSNDDTKRIIGITLPNKDKIYLTPLHQAYQVYMQKYAKASSIAWYCTEVQAKRAGLESPSMDSLTKR